MKEDAMKVLKCADLGFQCEGIVRAESVDEVLQQAAAHAKAVHGVDVTPELAEKVKAATRTE
jgi:predicted small metal-binding protein